MLCNTLEKREQSLDHGLNEGTEVTEDGKASVSGEEKSTSLPELSEDYRKEYDAPDSVWTVVETSKQYQIIGFSPADSNTEDLKKNTEEFNNPFRDTQIISEAQTERKLDVQTENIHINEEITVSAAPDLIMDRVTRSMIFSLSSSRNGSREDLTKSTLEDNPVVGFRKDVWIPPPDRNSKLKVLRGEERFEIRSHLPETSPSKLFVDSDDEDNGKARIGSHQFTPEKAWELEQERRDIIKKQGQRKSLDTEDLINIKDSNDSLLTNKQVNGTSSSQPTTDIDMEQISFEAARKQFVELEKKRNSLPITPRLQHRPPRLSSLSSLSENYNYSDLTKHKEPSILEPNIKPYTNESARTQETTTRERSSSLLRKQFLKDFSVDSVDAGEQEKSSAGDTSHLVSEEKNNIPNPSDETPIEREIRLALEREENLRKERGIQHSVETIEIVEIQKNPVLSTSTESQLSKKSKDKARTSFFLQREIQREEQREADLKNEGKVAGLYDKGSAQEIEERRRLFEQPDDILVQPQKNPRTTSKSTIADIQNNTDQTDLGADNEKTNLIVKDAPLPYSVRTKWKPTPLNPYRTRRLSVDNILDIRTPNETSTAQETSQEAIVYKEHFQFQPLKFSFHVQDQAEEKDHKTPVSVNGVELYHKKLRPSRSILIEEEIRKNLEREQELQEQRRMSELPLGITPKEENCGYNQYGKPMLTTDEPRPWSPVSRRNTLSSPIPSSPIQMLTPRTYPKFGHSESEFSSLKRYESS